MTQNKSLHIQKYLSSLLYPIWPLCNKTDSKQISSNTNLSGSNNSLLNDEWVKEENKKEIKKNSLTRWKWKHTTIKTPGHMESGLIREIYNSKYLRLKKIRKHK